MYRDLCMHILEWWSKRRSSLSKFPFYNLIRRMIFSLKKFCRTRLLIGRTILFTSKKLSYGISKEIRSHFFKVVQKKWERDSRNNSQISRHFYLRHLIKSFGNNFHGTKLRWNWTVINMFWQSINASYQSNSGRFNLFKKRMVKNVCYAVLWHHYVITSGQLD